MADAAARQLQYEYKAVSWLKCVVFRYLCCNSYVILCFSVYLK